MKIFATAYQQNQPSFIALRTLLMLSASLMFGWSASANTELPAVAVDTIPYNEIKTGSLYLKTPEGYLTALRQDSDYQVDVNGLLARTQFSQTFKNNSEHYVEAVYVFPLIDDAAVDSMLMEIGARRIVGKIKERQQAKKLYQQAKQQGKKASLVTQQRPNIFTSKVSNIAPGESIKITISYLQSVNYHNDEFSMRIPLTITPRYMPKMPQGLVMAKDIISSINSKTVINHSGWADITPPQIRDSAGQTVNIAISLHTGLILTNIVSRYHQVTKKTQTNTTTIALANSQVLLDRDFVLTWQVAQSNAPKAAFFQMTDEHYHYGLLMIMPPIVKQGDLISKDVTYIIDTSGSMAGVAIKQAKQALQTALGLLNEDDSFNIIAFNNDTDTLFKRNLIASAVNITLAKHWLNKLSAGGGTGMYPAIKQALHRGAQEPSLASKYKQVIFITDGSVANEQQLFRLIEDNLGDTRLHTVGIGSAPNSYFMSRAAELGRGTYRYIGRVNEVSGQMYKLFSEISQPVMSHLTLHWPVTDVEYYPRLIPDLYQHQPMVVSARWPKSSNDTTTTIKVKGQLAQSTWLEDINITNKINESKPGLAQWWARQKIKHLRQQQSRGDAQKKLLCKAQITALALKHGLISPYTSFVAIEEIISPNNNTALTTTKVANLMPKGSTQVIPLANTSLGIKGYLYSGIILVLLGLLLLRLSVKQDHGV